MKGYPYSEWFDRDDNVSDPSQSISEFFDHIAKTRGFVEISKHTPARFLIEAIIDISIQLRSFFAEGGYFDDAELPDSFPMDPLGFKGAESIENGNPLSVTKPAKVKKLERSPPLSNFFGQLGGLLASLVDTLRQVARFPGISSAIIEEELDLQRTIRTMKLIRKRIEAAKPPLEGTPFPMNLDRKVAATPITNRPRRPGSIPAGPTSPAKKMKTGLPFAKRMRQQIGPEHQYNKKNHKS